MRPPLSCSGGVSHLCVALRVAEGGKPKNAFYRQKARQMVEKQLQLELSLSSNGGGQSAGAAGQQPQQVAASDVQLLLHDYNSFNMLTCLTSLAQLVGQSP